MAAQVGFRKILNDVIDGPSLVERLKVGANATKARMVPGALVIRDTNDYSVKECGAEGKAIGWLGYEKANANFKPETRDSSYNVGDEVPVHNGNGFKVRAILTTGQAVTKGEFLDASGNGTLLIATLATGDIKARAAESVTTTIAEDYIWVISEI